jgi:serine/threonine protein kinase
VTEAEITNEVKVMMSLESRKHENIVKILGHGSLGVYTASYFIDMEYCDINLEEYIQGSARPCLGLYEYRAAKLNKDLPWLICAIMQQILRGVIFIHQSGKVHRDLKPRNGMFSIALS